MAQDVLLVDDDPIQGATRKLILEKAGHEVKVAANGSDALAFLRSIESKSLRMIITDHLMPGMNGPDFVLNLRDLGCVLPVLVLSGDVEAEDEYEGLNVTFRVKPFHPDQLIALIEYLITHAERRTA